MSTESFSLQYLYTLHFGNRTDKIMIILVVPLGTIDLFQVEQRILTTMMRSNSDFTICNIYVSN